MRFGPVLVLLLLAGCPAAVTVVAHKPLPTRPHPPLAPAADIDRTLTQVATDATSEFPALKPERLALAVIDLKQRRVGTYQGDVSYYPASVVKLAYLAYYEAAKEAGRVNDTPELRRAVKDMITVSSNDATGFVVDSITGTTSGPELTGADWDAWKAKRNVVTEWYRARGFVNLNANQKSFCDGSYGREQAYRDEGRNRNRFTALEAARVMTEIVNGDVASASFTEEMTTLLAREAGDGGGADTEHDIARRVLEKLPPGTRLWSKSGDAYEVRHLVGHVVLPSGADLVIAVFTDGVRGDLTIIPRIYENIANRF